MAEELGKKIARLVALRDAIKDMRDSAGKLELEIIQEFEANGQSLFEDNKFKARIPVKREYDVSRFVSIMGEILTPDQMREVYSPEHTVEKVVPASVNGVKAKKLWDMGMAEKLEQTLLPNKRQLKIETKTKEQAL